MLNDLPAKTGEKKGQGYSKFPRTQSISRCGEATHWRGTDLHFLSAAPTVYLKKRRKKKKTNRLTQQKTSQFPSSVHTCLLGSTVFFLSVQKRCTHEDIPMPEELAVRFHSGPGMMSLSPPAASPHSIMIKLQVRATTTKHCRWHKETIPVYFLFFFKKQALKIMKVRAVSSSRAAPCAPRS